MNYINQESGSSIENKPRRSRLWKVGRFCLIGLAVLVTLFALFHLEENWRGKRAWENYKQKMSEQGAVFRLEDLAPPPVPDEQNFAMTPLLKPILDLNPSGTVDAEGNLQLWRDPEGKARVEAIKLNDPQLLASATFGMSVGSEGTEGEQGVELPKQPEWRLGERFQLEQWQKYYAASKVFPSWPEPRGPAEDVLKALSRFDDELAELKEASKRPYSRFDVDYDNEDPISILLPHLSVLRNIARVVQLRAVAELAAGNVDAAFEDVNLMFALADSIENEPLLISHLVRAAMLKVTIQTIWEGMNDHLWTPQLLDSFQRQLSDLDLLAELKLTIEAERAFGSVTIEQIARDPGFLLAIADGSPAGWEQKGFVNLVPRGWWYLEALNHSRAFDQYMLPALPDNSRQLNVEKVKEKYGEIERILGEMNHVRAFLKHGILMKMLLPALEQAVKRSTETQVFCDMTLIALKLERHRFANGTYPQSLDALVTPEGRPLPYDLITHKPFQYELTQDGSYRLWSVGWNELDDGGIVLIKENDHGRSFERDQPDWVWPSTEGMRFEKVER